MRPPVGGHIGCGIWQRFALLAPSALGLANCALRAQFARFSALRYEPLRRRVDSLFDLRSSDLSVVVSISDVKRPSEFSARSANLVIKTFAEPAAN